MSGQQVIFRELDLSEQLRMLMVQEKMTVAELAAAAGVSKSAMEKYLAGPSSPRATAVASLCANLGLSVEWLLFGYSDNDRRRIRDLATWALFQLMQELKTPGALRDGFEKVELGSTEFTSFALGLATERADELGAKLWDARRESMRRAADGWKEVPGAPIDMPVSGDASDS